MRSLLDRREPSTGRRLRLLVVAAGVIAIVVTFATADTAYAAVASVVPGLALASVATAVTYERRSDRTPSLHDASSPTAAPTVAVPEVAVWGSDAA